MPRLVRRSLRCFYCNKSSRNDQAGIPRTWTCPHCEALNHLDERGDITDPQVPETPPTIRYARGLSPVASTMAPPAESPFCDDCQRNQAIVTNAMAEYIPDEDDAEYEHYVATADGYRAELETRYPPVCGNCIGRVRDQVRAAGYTARTDHLRRILENSKKRKMQFYTPRQLWTLRIIWVAKWAYISSVLIGLLYHGLGTVATTDALLAHNMEVSFWSNCFSQFLNYRAVDATCFKSPSLLPLVQYALVADFFTLWWNSKLKQMVNRPGGRMLGLITLWITRIFVLSLRIACLYYLQDVPEGGEARQLFHAGHGVMLAFIVVSLLVSWKAVHLEYQSIASFMQPLDPYLPNAPSRDPASQPRYQPIKPKVTTFDTMAQSFTSSISGPGDMQALDLPPSPTATDSSDSHSSHDDAFTPYMQQHQRQDDAMDWTPTQKRFGKQPVPLEPSIYTKQSPSQPRQDRQPYSHSIFAEKDPNPFAHRVPAFPKGNIPAREKQDPWKPGVWSPALPETKRNFFAEMIKQGGGERGREEEKEKLRGAVPKNVKKDEELFKKPQFKYDYYGYTGEKTTGLEDGFNHLFKK